MTLSNIFKTLGELKKIQSQLENCLTTIGMTSEQQLEIEQTLDSIKFSFDTEFDSDESWEFFLESSKLQETLNKSKELLLKI